MHDVIIVGAGPIGMACAIEAQKRNMNALILEKGCLTHSLYHFPTHMTFFSTPDLIEIGGIPFICRNEKPTRLEALEYYRRVARYFHLNIHLYEKVIQINGEDGSFEVVTSKNRYAARKVIIAIGFYDRPRLMHVPGEELEKVDHYYHEPHPYANQELLIVGSGNSAVIAALECFRYGAYVTLAVRSNDFHQGVKYWLRPDIDNRIQSLEIKALFNTHVVEIKPDSVVLKNKEMDRFELKNDFVLALTGYEPDYTFLKAIGINISKDAFQTPVHDTSTYQTNRNGVYLAGVVVGGLRTNKWFIENSRDHAVSIFDHITGTLTTPTCES